MEQTIHLLDVDMRIIDLVALGWFIFGWFGYARYADQHYASRTNLMRTMDMMRMRWMEEMMKRDNRIMDATLIGNLLRSIVFFASTTMLILLGLITILGAQTQGSQVIKAVPFAEETSAFMWEVKILTLGLLFIYAFFKLTWSLRQYNYSCALIGAAPMPRENSAEQEEYAQKLGRLISNAARHFNMGLRAYYFGLAAVGWFFGAEAFIALTTLIVYVVYRREFRSHTMNHIAGLEKI